MKRRNGLHRSILIYVIALGSVIAHAQVTVAILDFDNNSILEREYWAPLSSGLAQILTTEMDPLSSIKIVERRRLRDLMDEVKLSQTGLIDERQSVSIGKLAGARYMVFGAFLVTQKEKIRIDIRFVDVETGEAVKAGQQTGNAKDFLKLMKKLVKNMLDDIEIPLNKVDSQQLNSAKSYPVQALIAYSKGIKREDADEFREAVTLYREALSYDKEFEPALLQIEKIREMLIRRKQIQEHQ